MDIDKVFLVEKIYSLITIMVGSKWGNFEKSNDIKGNE